MPETEMPTATATTPATPAKLSAISNFPQWFGAIFALVYLSGYLVDFFYYSSRGVVDIGGEVLKLHYVHIGLEFIIACVVVVAPAFYLFFGRKLLDQQSDTVGTPFPRTNTWLMLTAILYWFSLFVAAVYPPPHYFSRPEHLYRYWGVVGIALTFAAYAAVARPPRISSEQGILSAEEKAAEEKRRNRIGLLFIAIIILLDAVVFSGMFRTFRQMLPNFIFFLLFCVGIASLIPRTYDFLSLATSWNVRTVIYAVFMLSTVVVLFFVTLLSYAYFVFPFVPSMKGGADYSEAPRFTVLVADGTSEKTRTDMILVYSTSQALFFATPERGNDACNWRRGAHMKQFIQIRREHVRSMSLQPEAHNCLS
jgi:hypothetical protein